MTEPLKIGIAGLGTVGGGVVKALAARGAELASAPAGRSRSWPCRRATGTRNAASTFRGFRLADDPVALATGSDDRCRGRTDRRRGGRRRQLVETALRAGKHVVTANKALLAKHGAALAALAEKNGVTLKFEAAVAGGIPIVKALRESLIGNGIDAVNGILNGTCNYILTEMERGPHLRRCAEGGAGPRLCRGRSHLRCRRRRHRAQARAADHARLRHAHVVRVRLCRRHREHHARRHRGGRRSRLPHQAARRGAAHR